MSQKSDCQQTYLLTKNYSKKPNEIPTGCRLYKKKRHRITKEELACPHQQQKTSSPPTCIESNDTKPKTCDPQHCVKNSPGPSCTTSRSSDKCSKNEKSQKPKRKSSKDSKGRHFICYEPCKHKGTLLCKEKKTSSVSSVTSKRSKSRSGEGKRKRKRIRRRKSKKWIDPCPQFVFIDECGRAWIDSKDKNTPEQHPVQSKKPRKPKKTFCQRCCSLCSRCGQRKLHKTESATYICKPLK